MSKRIAGTAVLGLALLLLVAGSPSPLRAETTPTQATRAELVTLTGEVLALDLATREITLLGPLGGTIAATVDPQVKNLPQVKVGDLVEISYYQSVAISAHKAGEPNPLFTGGEASSAAPGERPAADISKQKKVTVTVVSVDVEKRMLVVQGPDGTLFSSEVERPEFAVKLKNLKAGDKLDVVVTQALAMSVTPAAPGSKPSAAYAAGTLVVDRGEVLQAVGTTLLLRNERGRTVRVKVDPTYKFSVDGKEVSVYDLKPGTRLTRTAFRVTDVEYVAAP